MITMALHKLKTVKQMAEELGISDSRVRQLCIQAGIDGILLGGAKYLTPSDVKKLRAIDRRKYEKAS